MDLRHDGGALSNGGRDAFSRAGPHVADGEHAGLAGLERQDARRDALVPSVTSAPVTTKPLSSTATQCSSQAAFGSAPMNRKRWRSEHVCRPRLAVVEYRTSKSTDLVALQPDNFGVGVQFDIGKCSNPIDEIARHRSFQALPAHH